MVRPRWRLHQYAQMGYAVPCEPGARFENVEAGAGQTKPAMRLLSARLVVAGNVGVPIGEAPTGFCSHAQTCNS